MKGLRRYFSNMKLQKKMAVSYLLACIIPLMFLSGLIYQTAVENLEKASLEFADIFQSQIVVNIENFCSEYDDFTRMMLMDNEVLFHLNEEEGSILEQVNRNIEFQQLVQKMLILKDEIYSIAFITADQQVYQTGNRGITIHTEHLLDADWLPEQNPFESFLLSPVHLCEYYEENQDYIAITVIRKIYDYRGKYMGMLLIDVDPYSLVALSDEFYLARDQYNAKISVTDRQGAVLYDSDVYSGNVTWEEARAKDYRNLYENLQEDYIVTTAEVQQAPLLVNIIIPRSELLFRINNVNYMTAIAVICCGFTVLLISTMFSRMISRPLRNLQEKIAGMEQGAYEVLPFGEGRDEIGTLIQGYNRMVRRIKELIEVIYEEQIRQKEAKYLALKNQINPHMLYNTLESIRMKALLRGEDEIAEMIKILAKMFRLVLGKEGDLVRIQDEISYVESYIKLQDMRFPNQFQLHVEVQEALLEKPCMSMILQPIVENCIEHGRREDGRMLHILLKGYLEEGGWMQLQIEDDGRGMSAQQMEQINQFAMGLGDDVQDKAKSIGLKNIAERVMLYYGEGSSLRVKESRDGKTVIGIRIPSQSQREE